MLTGCKLSTWSRIIKPTGLSLHLGGCYPPSRSGEKYLLAALYSRVGIRFRPVGSHALLPGKTISFMPEAIHRIEILVDQPTMTFNLYGKPNQAQQLEFEPIAQSAKTS